MRIGSFMLCLTLLAGLDQAGAAPAPAGEPAQRPAQMRAWLLGLADPSPEVREESRHQLMGLGRADLPVLRGEAERYRPLDRALLDILRDIVTHVYLAEDPYPREERHGFLGITLTQDPEEEDRKLQIVVASRMKGFAGYRFLRDGDVIIDIEEAPLPAQVAHPRMLREIFIESIKARRPGQTVHLKVLRQGRELRIPVTLGARPRLDDRMDIVAELHNRRERAAQAFWAAEFEPRLTGKPLPLPPAGE